MQVLLINALIVLAALWYLYDRYWPAKGVRGWKADEIKERLKRGEKLQIIDLRPGHEFNRGHIKGAKSIPWRELSQRKDEIQKGRETLFVCGSGYYSKKAARLLVKNGFTRVGYLLGGMHTWKTGGYMF